jgi:hypothetical protein
MTDQHEQEHDADLDRQMNKFVWEEAAKQLAGDLAQMTDGDLAAYRKQFEWQVDALLAEEHRRWLQRPGQSARQERERQLRPARDAPSMIRDGGYDLTPEAAAIYWYLHSQGIWEPGHPWFGHADIRMTSDQSIQMTVSLSQDSVRRGLAELEEKQFIRRKQRIYRNGMQGNDDIEFTVPEDWCPDCHERKHGEHECRPDGRPCPDHVQAYRERFGDDAARRYFETDDLDTAGHEHR